MFSAPVPVWAGGANNGFGNARKDIVLGPGRFNFDTSLYKTFKIHESTNFEFRAESFNTFNHTDSTTSARASKTAHSVNPLPRGTRACCSSERS